MSLPLEGIRVLDWTIWQQGPVASVLLGDLGAEVIKIEERASGDPGRGLMRIYGRSLELPGGRTAYFESNNRNKKGLALDLKKEKGKEIIYRLVGRSDVFVQNFRPGVAARLGLDYATLSRYNPQLIYATASGYGLRGPDANAPSFDYVGQAKSGIMYCAGEADMPPLHLMGGIADQMGAIMLAYGVLAALVARERLGVGQEIDISHLGSMIALQGLLMNLELLTKKEIPRPARARMANPLWNHYRCSDGKWIVLAMLQADRYWPDLCRALGLGELEKAPRFADMEKRERNCEELIALMDGAFAQKPSAEWVRILKEKGDFVFAVIKSRPEVYADPQPRANDYIVEFDHPSLGRVDTVGVPVRFSRTPAGVRLPAPELGQHTEELLSEICGYTWEEIAELRRKEVI